MDRLQIAPLTYIAHNIEDVEGKEKYPAIALIHSAAARLGDSVG
jgi:hypothetical protein